MSWKTLFNAAQPEKLISPRNAQWWREVRDAIETAEPAIYWYPGRGEDFTPLVLDVPNNPANQRLFPLSAPRQRRPLILWMNDYAADYAEFPKWRSLGPCSSNAQLWKRLGADVAVMCRRVELTLPTDHQPMGHSPIRLRLFEVRVTNDSQAVRRQRPRGGDRYVAIFSPAESEELLRSIIVEHRLHVELVALVRQGSLSGQRPAYPYMKPFRQYTDVPLLLEPRKGTFCLLCCGGKRSMSNERIIDHLDCPYHRAHAPHATHAHAVSNPLCGDMVRIDLAIDDAGVVREAYFDGVGCRISQAAASMLVEHVEGRSVDEIKRFSAADMLALFGPRLTPPRQRCCLLACQCLQVAIYSPITEENHESHE